MLIISILKSISINILFLAILFIIFLSCKKDNSSNENELNLISQWPVSIPETSGLASFHNDYFLTVSDSLSIIYLINKNGEIIRELEYIGENTEGVAYNPVGNELFVVEENTNEIVQLDTNGQIVNRFSVPLENKVKRHGLEGITYCPTNDHLYVVSEKLPAILFEIKKDGTVIDSHEINFAEDLSSVFYDEQLDLLWILSDDSKTLTRCNLDGEPDKTWDTGVKKGEGLVVDSKNNRVYIVTDGDSYLNIYSF